MASLYVRQRVRIIGREYLAESNPYGETGTIVKSGGLGAVSLRMFDWVVLTDAGQYVCCDSHDLEPILPGGLESPEEIAELFEPSPETLHA